LADTLNRFFDSTKTTEPKARVLKKWPTSYRLLGSLIFHLRSTADLVALGFKDVPIHYPSPPASPANKDGFDQGEVPPHSAEQDDTESLFVESRYDALGITTGTRQQKVFPPSESSQQSLLEILTQNSGQGANNTPKAANHGLTQEENQTAIKTEERDSQSSSRLSPDLLIGPVIEQDRDGARAFQCHDSQSPKSSGRSVMSEGSLVLGRKSDPCPRQHGPVLHGMRTNPAHRAYLERSSTEETNSQSSSFSEHDERPAIYEHVAQNSNSMHHPLQQMVRNETRVSSQPAATSIIHGLAGHKTTRHRSLDCVDRTPAAVAALIARPLNEEYMDVSDRAPNFESMSERGKYGRTQEIEHEPEFPVRTRPENLVVHKQTTVMKGKSDLLSTQRVEEASISGKPTKEVDNSLLNPDLANVQLSKTHSNTSAQLELSGRIRELSAAPSESHKSVATEVAGEEEIEATRLKCSQLSSHTSDDIPLSTSGHFVAQQLRQSIEPRTPQSTLRRSIESPVLSPRSPFTNAQEGSGFTPVKPAAQAGRQWQESPLSKYPLSKEPPTQSPLTDSNRLFGPGGILASPVPGKRKADLIGGSSATSTPSRKTQLSPAFKNPAESERHMNAAKARLAAAERQKQMLHEQLKAIRMAQEVGQWYVISHWKC